VQLALQIERLKTYISFRKAVIYNFSIFRNDVEILKNRYEVELFQSRNPLAYGIR
jgi:hypothetical protein